MPLMNEELENLQKTMTGQEFAKADAGQDEDTLQQLNDLFNEELGGEEPAPEEEQTSEQPEEPEGEEPEEEPAEPTEEPGEEEEAPETPSEADALRAEVARLTELLGTKSAPAKEPEAEVPAVAETPTTPPPPAGQPIDFIGDKDVQEVLSSKEGLNELLNQVYNLGSQNTTTTLLRQMPGVVKANVEQYSTLQRATAKFYDDNQDLAEFKGAVSAVAQEVISEHPDWTIDQVFGEVEKESRKRLNLAKQAAEEESAESKTPAFAKVPKGKKLRGAKPKTSALATEIGELIDLED